MPIRLTTLAIPASGQFFKLKSPPNKAFVERLFRKIKELTGTKKLLAKHVRTMGTFHQTRFRYSFAMFKLKHPPSFLPTSRLVEISFGFLLIIEAHDYLGVFKKGVSGLDELLSSICTPVGRTELIHAYGDNALYKKLSLKRMTVSRYELEGSAYEAQDLETSLPTLAVSRSIPRFIRLLAASKDSVSITPSTSRIHLSGRKNNVQASAQLVLEVRQELERKLSPTFLDSFAVPVSRAALPPGVNPMALMFDLTQLVEQAGPDEPEVFLENSTSQSNRSRPITDRLRKRLERELLISPDGADWSFAARGTVRKLGSLKWLGEKLAVSINSRHKLVVASGAQKPTSFNTWLRGENAYSVTFSSPEFFYSSGQLFRFNDLSAEIRLLKNILQPIAELNNATSEKGDWDYGVRRPYLATDTVFRNNTTFDVLEKNIAKNTDHILCGDFGDEWADYLILDQRHEVLSFYHCKAGAVSPGATPFHIVISQALKNLGRVHIIPEYLAKKLDSAEQRNYWGNTQIALLRRNGDSWPAVKQGISEFERNPNAAWRVCLVVTMLSKTEFDLESARATPGPEFVQQVWLLTSFVSSCRERGAKPVVYCRT
jgi:hypothetical protein